MSHLVADAEERLRSAQEKLGAAMDMIGRCRAALEQGLAADIHGVRVHELISQYSALAATQAMLACKLLESVKLRMDRLHENRTPPSGL